MHENLPKTACTATVAKFCFSIFFLIVNGVASTDDVVKEDEDLLARRIKDELGEEYEENPLVLRDQVNFF